MNTSVHASPNFKDVVDFHEKFAVPHAKVPSFLGTELQGFREKFMEEELTEFKDACAAGDMENAADALIDLVYVAMGTAHMMGLPWQQLWDEVQRANMSKMRAQRAEDSARGTAFDVIKPAGWQKPDHRRALLESSDLSLAEVDTALACDELGGWPEFTGYERAES